MRVESAPDQGSTFTIAVPLGKAHLDPLRWLPSAMKVLCVLPARIGSTRLPRKPLQRIAGRPLIEWSWRAATRAAAFDALWVATDSEQIAGAVRDFGGTALLTASDLPSGTDRVASVASLPEAEPFHIFVNCQADEPFLPPGSIEPALAPVRGGSAEIATLATPIRSDADLRSASVVKVTRATDGRALYFSRAPIPHVRDDAERPDHGERPDSSFFLRHVGVYVYTRAALERWAALPPSPLEQIEKLEQLRPLEAGLAIHVAVAPGIEPGIDLPADVERAERLLGDGVGAS